jgi:hypothetical protein
LAITGLDNAGVILDDTGRAWPPHPLSLARQLGCPTGDFDVIEHAVRDRGFVHVAPLRDALVVKFDPARVHHLAAIGAFYEIAGRAPKRLILACPGTPGSPDRYEIFHSFSEGLKRLEAAAEAFHNSTDPVRAAPPGARGRRHRSRDSRRSAKKTRQIVSLWRTDQPTIRRYPSDFSKRLCLPLDAISPEDDWLAQLLDMWREARGDWRLPAYDAFDPSEALNIARGRAHIVDTRDADPLRYRFRLWGAVSSYGRGRTNRTLAQMPAGVMRDDAIEDYWEAVSTGVPNYQLIHLAENGLAYSYSRLLLPLAADGQRVDRLLVLFNERLLPELKRP